MTFDPDTDVDLRQLINQSQSLARQQQTHRQPSLTKTSSLPSSLTLPGVSDDMAAEYTDKADEIALDNADNPLQLLAMASAMPNQSPASAVTPSPAAVSTQTPTQAVDADDTELQSFFGSLSPVLDNSPDIDPVELGLVTDEEAESLFK